MCHSSGIECKYFVLNPRSKKADDPYAKASRKAMEAYAREIAGINLGLAENLLRWVERENQAVNKLPLTGEMLYSQWIEKKVFVSSGSKGLHFNWYPVIKCGAAYVDETLSFFRRSFPKLEYRIAPEK